MKMIQRTQVKKKGVACCARYIITVQPSTLKKESCLCANCSWCGRGFLTSQRIGNNSTKMKVCSDPLSVAPSWHATEVHLADRAIEEIAGFGRFLNLESLWLNRNRLTSLRGLEPNFRLKHLYVFRNNLTSIREVTAFAFLESFHAFSNQIKDLEDVLRSLKQLRHLKTLDLFDNPVAQEENYRQRVIRALPWIQVLDRIRVRDEETKEARKISKAKQVRTTQVFRNKTPEELAGEPSACTILLLEEVDAIIRRREQNEKEARFGFEIGGEEEEQASGETVRKPSFWKKEELPMLNSQRYLSEWEKLAVLKLAENYETDFSDCTIQSFLEEIGEEIGKELTQDWNEFALTLRSRRRNHDDKGFEDFEEDKAGSLIFEKIPVLLELLSLNSWKRVSKAKCQRKANSFFREAQKLSLQFKRSKNKDPELLDRMKTLMLKGNRLQSFVKFHDVDHHRKDHEENSERFDFYSRYSSASGDLKFITQRL